ncbi:hypothetical protein ACFL4S_00495, partial [bacterium]
FIVNYMDSEYNKILDMFNRYSMKTIEKMTQEKAGLELNRTFLSIICEKIDANLKEEKFKRNKDKNLKYGTLAGNKLRNSEIRHEIAKIIFDNERDSFSALVNEIKNLETRLNYYNKIEKLQIKGIILFILMPLIPLISCIGLAMLFFKIRKIFKKSEKETGFVIEAVNTAVNKINKSKKHEKKIKPARVIQLLIKAEFLDYNKLPLERLKNMVYIDKNTKKEFGRNTELTEEDKKDILNILFKTYRTNENKKQQAEDNNPSRPAMPLIIKKSSPAATDPAATDPAATDPAATDPAATDPAATDPAATDPAATDPAATDPAVTDPAVTDPAVTDATEATAAKAENNASNADETRRIMEKYNNNKELVVQDLKDTIVELMLKSYLDENSPMNRFIKNDFLSGYRNRDKIIAKIEEPRFEFAKELMLFILSNFLKRQGKKSADIFKKYYESHNYSTRKTRKTIEWDLINALLENLQNIEFSRPKNLKIREWLEIQSKVIGGEESNVLKEFSSVFESIIMPHDIVNLINYNKGACQILTHLRGIEGAVNALEKIYGKTFAVASSEVLKFLNDKHTNNIPAKYSYIYNIFKEVIDENSEYSNIELKYAEEKRIADIMSYQEHGSLKIMPTAAEFKALNKYRTALEKLGVKEDQIRGKLKSLSRELIKHEIYESEELNRLIENEVKDKNLNNRNEISEGRMKELEEAAHNKAKENAGQEQKEFIDVLEHIENLMNIRHITTRAEFRSLWDSINITRNYVSRKTNIKEEELIKNNIMFKVFKNVKKANMEAMIKEGFGAEIVISLEQMEGSGVKQRLEHYGLDKPGMRGILVHDIVNSDDENELEKMKKAVKELNTQAVWAIGKQGFKQALESNKNGKLIREMIRNKNAQAGCELINGTVIFSAGNLTKEWIDKLKGMQLKEQELAKRNMSAERYAVKTLNKLLRHTAKMIDVCGKDGSDAVKEYIAGKKDALNKLDKEILRKEFRTLDNTDVIKALKLGLNMIYGKEGIVNTKDYEEYRKIQGFKQLALGYESQIEGKGIEIKEAEELVNRADSSKKEAEKAYIRYTDEQGAIWMNIVENGEVKDTKAVDTPVKKPFETESIGNGEIAVRRAVFMSEIMVKLGITASGFGGLIKILTRKKGIIDEKNERESIRALAHAA